MANNKWITLIAETVGGGVVGALIGVPLTFLLGAIVPSEGGGFQDVVAALAGLYLGYVVGVALGVTLTGRNLMKHIGAWWAALAGAVAGALLTIAAASLGLANIPALVNPTFFILTALFAAAAYGWSASRSA